MAVTVLEVAYRGALVYLRWDHCYKETTDSGKVVWKIKIDFWSRGSEGVPPEAVGCIILKTPKSLARFRVYSRTL